MTISIPYGVKAFNKKEAFDYVTELLHNDPGNAELASLYLHFAPKPPKEAKTAEQWVAQAVGIKDVRFYLNYLYSDGVSLYATNGHILKWCPTDKPVGYYCPMTFNTVEGVDAKYPDTARVIPPLSKEGKRVFDLSNHTAEVLDGGKYTRYILGGFAFQKNYIDQCADGSILTITNEMEENRPIRGEHRFGEFVVMPMRM